MSTRGCVGIVCNGIEKIGYNHYDSYPEGLGVEVLDFLKGKSYDELKNLFEAIHLTNDEKDFQCWGENGFKNTFMDDHDFMKDGLFCEYAYLINLDTRKLEFYVGGYKKPGRGRYARKGTVYEGYYGVHLKKQIPLSKTFKGNASIA
ncbi:MAG: hypothetical protein IKP65_08795 [Alphaproteobacteria bacterium]|nr:hypothetical protein [Alphaproteobacteria bacterium]